MSDAAETILADYAGAVLRKDHAEFAELYHADVEVFDAWETWRFRGRPAVRKMAEEWFQSLGANRVEVTFSEVQSYQGSGIAAVSALATYAAVDSSGNRERSQVNRISMVLQRDADRWRIVHEHTSLPVGFTSKQAIPFRAS